MNLNASRRFEDLKVMSFIDGSNLLIELSRFLDVPFRAEKPPDMAITLCRDLIYNTCGELGSTRAIRHSWFASIQGSGEGLKSYEGKLREAQLTPVIFPKSKGREKRVDIALTTHLLVEAFSRNFDIGIVVTGDEDFISVVQEAKRYGAQIFGCFFDTSINPDLKREFDRFFPIGANMTSKTREEYRKQLQSDVAAANSTVAGK